METRTFQVYASHRQILLADGYIWKDSDPSSAASFWTRHAFGDRMAVADGMLGIITGSYGRVNAVLEIHELEPELDTDGWDHVVEGSLEITDGELQVASCLGDEAARVHLESAWYRVRCSQAGLAGARDSGGNCPDWYRLQVWPAAPQAVLVRKRATG